VPGTFEVFYLDRDEVPESDTGTRLWGANYDFTLSESSTFGASYLKFHSDRRLARDRDGLNVFNARAFTSPFRALPGLSFELEYAREDNGDRLGSDAFTGLAGYEMSKVAWSPKLSYRYAYYEGDDPATGTNEGFDPLLPGFFDWGTWWQGRSPESTSVQLQPDLAPGAPHLAPSDAVGTGLIFYKFLADRPAAYGPEGMRATWPWSWIGTWTGRSTRTSRSASWVPSPTRARWWSRPTTGRRTSLTEWCTWPTATERPRTTGRPTGSG
jgi:hypothetical protein